MSYAFLFGPVGIWVMHCVDDGVARNKDRTDLARGCRREAGARVEVRRLHDLPGNRPLNEGFALGPVSEDGIWRADLLLEVDPPTRAAHFHHHPNPDGVDVGARVYDEDMMADPLSWTMRKISKLNELLLASRFSELAAEVDMDEVERLSGAMRAAITECLNRVPLDLVEIQAAFAS